MRTDSNLAKITRAPSWIGAPAIGCLLFIAWWPTLTVGQGASANRTVAIALKATANCRGEFVTLGEIADIHADAQTRAELEQIDLAKCADQSHRFVLEKKQINARLVLSGLAGDYFQLTGADSVTVTRGVVRVAQHQLTPVNANGMGRQIQAAIGAHFARFYDVERSDVSVLMAKGSRIDKIQVPNSVTCTILESGESRLGKRQISIGFMFDGDLIEKRFVRADISVVKRVAVASQPINSGEVLSGDNVTIEERRFDDSSIEYALDERVYGRNAKRTLRRGQLIRITETRLPNSQIDRKKEFLVRANQSVSVIAESNGVRVVLDGAQALKSGRKGDVITVKNKQSQRTFQATITNKREVRVLF